MNVLYVFLFFQAEDGIRDLVRSRGLGDVYKRQAICNVPEIFCIGDLERINFTSPRSLGFPFGTKTTVSYTHLTLPTSDLV